MNETKTTKKSPLLKKKRAIKSPKSMATGDNRITILEHDIYRRDEKTLGAVLTVTNTSSETVSIALFEVVFYNGKGGILDKFEYKVLNLRPTVNRTFYIISPKPERNEIESYTIKLVKITITPTPTATGSDKLAILHHKMHETDKSLRGPMGSDGAQLVIKNILDTTVASAVFETIFYDAEGKVVYNFEHKETDIKPGNSRSVIIFPPERTHNIIKSYDIRVIRVTTADVEKVQVCGHDIRTDETGEEEVKGTVKNISNGKTDAILVASFYDEKREAIGAKAVILRDIEPGSIRKFYFKFKPQKEDIIRTYNLRVICDIDE